MQTRSKIHHGAIGATRNFTLASAPFDAGEHILCDLDRWWTRKQKKQFKQLWNLGHNIYDIARFLKRKDPDEVLLLWLEMTRKGLIRQREGGFLGNLSDMPKRV